MRVEYGGYGIDSCAKVLYGSTYYEQQCSLYANNMFLNYLLIIGKNKAEVGNVRMAD